MKKKERTHNFHSLPLNTKLDRPGQTKKIRATSKISNQKQSNTYSYFQSFAFECQTRQSKKIRATIRISNQKQINMYSYFQFFAFKCRTRQVKKIRAKNKISHQKQNTNTHIHIFHALPSNAEPDRARKLGQQARFQVNSQNTKSCWLSREKDQVPNYDKDGEEV